MILTTSAAARIEAIEPAETRRKVRRRIAGLIGGPKALGAEQLHGYADRYRFRQGGYRVLYHVDAVRKVVTIVGIGYRRR